MLVAIAAQPRLVSATPLVLTTDFIANGSRTNFSGFEDITGPSTQASSVHTEDFIRVEQVNGDTDPNAIWTTFNPGGMEGARAWYPNGGDAGYTRITKSDNSQFFNVGLLRGSGGGNQTLLLYELRLGGTTVLSGSVAHGQTARYLGFAGGGFDEILLRDTSLLGDTMFSHTLNALVIDSIELNNTSVPEPGSVLLLGTGLLAAFRCRRPSTGA